MLTIEFMPYKETEDLQLEDKINKIIKQVKKNKLVLLEGKLPAKEETALVEKTMKEVDLKKFKGIEIASISDEKEKDLLQRIKEQIAYFFIGNRNGFAVIGPASIVKKIKREPGNIKVFLNSKKAKKR